MANTEDTVTENVVLNDSQALIAIKELTDAIVGLTDKIGGMLAALGQMQSKGGEAADGVQKVSSAEKEGEGATDAFSAALAKAGTALQMAFGLGVYQIVNNFIGLIKTGVQDGIDFAQAMYLMNSAVSQMRDSGVDVQFQDLSNIVTTLGPKLQAFSNLDLSRIVGQVAGLGGQFGMTAKQVSDLTEFSMIAVERFGGDAVSIATAVTSAMENLTTQMSRRIYQMTSAQISTLDVYNEAIQLSLDNGAKTYQQLDDHAKQLAYITLIEQKLVGLQQDEATYADNAAGKVKNLGAAWQNLWTGFGIAVTNIMPELTQGLDNMIDTFARIAGFIQAIRDELNNPTVFYTLGAYLDDLNNKINAYTKQIYDLYTNPSPSTVTGAPGTSGIPGESTTPLGSLPPPSSTTDIAKIEADAEKEIVSLHDSEAAALVKIQTDLGNKLVDIDTQTNEKEIALEVDKANKLSDINLKYERDMEALQVDEANKAQAIQNNTAETLLVDAEKKRLDDLQAEQKYQESLQSIRDQFGLNLEDALRARDAKTIIHLIEQYDLQKTQQAKQYADETLVRNQNYQQEIDLANQAEAYDLQKLQTETQQRAQVLATQRNQEITDLNTDIARRQAALAVERQNEIDAANLQAQRQATAEATDIANRLKAWEDGLQVQYNLTDAQMKNIYNDINAYLGAGGMVDSIYTYIIARMAQVYATLGAVPGATTHAGSSSPSLVKPMASGGSLFASTPTSVTFGEAGPELAMFLPLGSNFGGSPAASFAGGLGGSLQLQLLLDPNLEARIVQTSLSSVALSIDRVQRESQ